VEALEDPGIFSAQGPCLCSRTVERTSALYVRSLMGSDKRRSRSTVQTSVNNDHQLEFNSLRCSEPVKTGKSVCNMIRATKTGDRLSCRVEDRLKTVDQTKPCIWVSHRPARIIHAGERIGYQR